MNKNSKEILIFLVITFIFSYALEFYVVFNGGVKAFGFFLLTVLMWIPGLVSIVQRLVQKSGFDDVGLRLGSGKYYLIAFVVIFVASFISYSLGAVLNLREFGMVSGVPISKIVLQYSIIFGIGLISAFGEELGWRGFLVPKIYSTGWKYPTTITGIVWALWHLPLVAFGGYYTIQSPVLIILCYTASIMVFNYFINWLRMESGSMWVATVCHAFYNFFFQTFWLHLLFKQPGLNVKYWEVLGADAGILPALVMGAVALVVHFKMKNGLVSHQKIS